MQVSLFGRRYLSSSKVIAEWSDSGSCVVEDEAVKGLVFDIGGASFSNAGSCILRPSIENNPGGNSTRSKRDVFNRQDRLPSQQLENSIGYGTGRGEEGYWWLADAFSCDGTAYVARFLFT